MKSLLTSLCLFPLFLMAQNLVTADSFCTQNYFGYRFELNGDFNGDGVLEKMVEKFKKNGVEVDKFYPVWDFMEYQINENGCGAIEDSTDEIEKFQIYGDLGLEFAEVLPDINGNGKDEIGYVNYHADASSVNSYKIIELSEKNDWEQIYAFEIRDWEIPNHPWYTDRPRQEAYKEHLLSSYSRIFKIGETTFEYEGYYEKSSFNGFSSEYSYKDKEGFWFKYYLPDEKYDLYICCAECEESFIDKIELEMDYYFCLACNYKFRVTWK